eukprot:gene3690-4736_t
METRPTAEEHPDAERAMIARERLAHDQRRVMVSLTPTSRTMFRQMKPSIEAVYQALDTDLGPELTGEIYDTLDRFLARLAPAEAQDCDYPATRAQVSATEWQQRVDLAAAFRLADHYRWTDQIYTHFTAKIPGTSHFLINPYGVLFDEVTASCLVTVDLDGNVILDPTGMGINPAGFLIHSCVHRARPDFLCVLHTHTASGLAVAAQKRGLLNLTQHAMRFHNRIGYHDYEGVALETAEQARLVSDLGNHKAMILRNHGLLAAGTTI